MNTYASVNHPLVDLLNSYDPEDRDQEVILQQMLRFVKEHDDCLKRTCIDGHFTGSCWLLSPDESALLMTHHKKLGKWLQLGGHADGEQDLLQVALQEAREESGINNIDVIFPGVFDLDIHEIPARGKEPAHLHLDLRFALRAAHWDCVVSDESHDLAWVSLSELERYTIETAILRMKRKWFSRKVHD